MSQARFQKQQREKAKRERAEAKSERKSARRADAESRGEPEPSGDQSAVLAALAALHERFAAEEMDFEEFELRKAQLTERLRVG